MKNRFRIGITIFLLLLTIGFATVTTNLIVNNLTNISLTPDDFNVYFSKAITNDSGSASISSDNKIITYSTNTLVNIGDKAELTYRITNDSKQYDAQINLAINFDDIEDKDRFKITYITFSDQDSYLLEAKTSKEGKVIIELLKPYIKDASVSFNITIDAEAKSRSSIASGENYNLIFDSQGGSEVENKTVEYGHQYGNLSTPTKNGFTFLGWYRGDELVSEDTFIDNNNETLEAHWERNNYNINIDLNGGSSNQSLSHNIPYEDEIELSVPTRNNYIFDGWESNIDSTIINGNLIKMGYNDTTIKAKWKPMSYYVKYNGNGSTSGGMLNQEIKYDSKTSLSNNNFAKTNYTFAGWTTNPNSKIVEYLNSEQVTNITTGGTTINLYAVWVVTTTNYGYQASIRTYDINTKGIYRLEVWGARGGNITGYNGGAGGYSIGEIELNAGIKLSIATGGVGVGASNPGQSLAGGYNGGGSVTGNGGVNHITASGGGATHIAIYNSSYGILPSYPSKDILNQYVLIVAGGGGGARNQANHENAARWGHGGAGGGLQSSGVYSNYGTTTLAKRNVCIATQTAGYRFGLGGSGNGNSAGGGGYMGGYPGDSSCGYTGAGNGGSGYIAKLSNANSYNGEQVFISPNGNSETGHFDNGYARITFIRGTK
ncbi:MAG: InlB B-repeat-containing protein [Bacilli bacterium]|nr:InlB B-repeat-containing protein [Bacilli bacterium]